MFEASSRQEFEEVVKAYDNRNILRVVVEKESGISRRRQLARPQQDFPHSTQYSSQREIGEDAQDSTAWAMGGQESRKGRGRNIFAEYFRREQL